MLTKDLRIAPRANAVRGAPRAVRRLPGPRGRPGLSTAELTPPWPGGAALRPIPAGARVYARGLRAGVRVAALRRRSGMARPGQADSAACRLVSTESPGRSEGRPALRGARLWHRRAVSARHTHPPAFSRAERLRLCEPHKSAGRSQSRTSSSGWTSATARSSSLRSPLPMLRDSSAGGARRREPAVVCQQPPVVRSAQFGIAGGHDQSVDASTATVATTLVRRWYRRTNSPPTRDRAHRQRGPASLPRFPNETSSGRIFAA